MSLTALDMANLANEAKKVVQDATVRSIWRDSESRFGLYLYRDANEKQSSLRVTLDIALGQELSYFAFGQAEQVEPSILKARKKQHDAVLAKLRKSLLGSRVTSVDAVPDERIVVISFNAEQPDGLEDVSAPRLILELLGKRCHLILTDERDEILVVHRHGRSYGNRNLIRGETYTLPPPRNSTRGAEASKFTPDETEHILPFNQAIRQKMRALTKEKLAHSRYAQLHRILMKALKRLKSRLAKLTKERGSAREADQFQRQAELLKIHSTRIKRGTKEFEVVDDFCHPPIKRVIILDPSKSIHEIAAALFKKARKLRRGQITIEQRLGETEADLENLEALRESLANIDPDDEASLDEFEAKLAKSSCAPLLQTFQTLGTQKAAKHQQNSGPRRFVSQDQLTILVGRSNAENDKLSLQIARGNDLFFHVRGSPGSHVIVRKEREKSVPLETLLDAAVLAVHFSKQRGNPGAEVSYTPAKYIRKPKGAKPGLVQICQEKVLRPGRAEERLKRLLDSLRKGKK